MAAKIIDLGLAKAVDEPGYQIAISMPGAFVGTPEFARAICRSRREIRSDLYSLGVILWEMMTGQAPFRSSLDGVMYQQQRAPLPLEQLEGLPQPVVILVEVLPEKTPLAAFSGPGRTSEGVFLTKLGADEGQN